MPSDKFAQWWLWDGVLYKQTSTICKPKPIRIFALIINCTIIMKTNSRFSRNVYAISDRIWCNKHLRHTTTENMMGKVDTSDLMMIITWAIDISFQSPGTEMGQLNTYNPINCNENERLSIGLSACYTHLHKRPYKHLYVFSACE